MQYYHATDGAAAGVNPKIFNLVLRDSKTPSLEYVSASSPAIAVLKLETTDAYGEKILLDLERDPATGKYAIVIPSGCKGGIQATVTASGTNCHVPGIDIQVNGNVDGNINLQSGTVHVSRNLNGNAEVKVGSVSVPLGSVSGFVTVNMGDVTAHKIGGTVVVTAGTIKTASPPPPVSGSSSSSESQTVTTTTTTKAKKAIGKKRLVK